MSTGSAAGTPAGGRTRADRLTGRRTVVVLAVVGAVATAAAAAQPWASGTAAGAEVAIRSVTASGGQLSPVVPGLALVGGAAAVAAATTGRVARLVSVAVLTLAGVGVVAATLAALSGVAQALGRRAAELSARTGTVAMTAHTTAWPWLAVAGGVLLVLAGVLAVAGVRAWPLPSARYERAPRAAGSRAGSTVAGATGPAAPDAGLSLWEQVGRELDVDAAVEDAGAPTSAPTSPPVGRDAPTASGTPRPDERPRT